MSYLEPMELPPAHDAADPCPRCGRIFERGFTTEQGAKFAGHIPGSKTCIPDPQMPYFRDARLRKANRRGQS